MEEESSLEGVETDVERASGRDDSSRGPSRDQILRAARECFVIYGYRATTVEHVAEKAGTSRTTVMRVVGGRQKLVDAVLVEEAVGLLDRLSEVGREAKSLDELIGGVVRAALLEIDERPLLRRAAGPDILTLLPGATTSGVPMISALAIGGRGILHQVRGRMGGTGVPSDVFDDLVEDLIRYIIALLHTPTIDGRNRDPDAMAQRASRLFVPAFEAAVVRAIRAATAPDSTS